MEFSVPEVTGACRSADFEMYVRASDNAPPIRVVGVAARWLSFVSLSNFAKFWRIALSTTAKGRYLLGLSSWAVSGPPPFMSTSPFVSPFCLADVASFVGYKKLVLCECEAMTAISFALPEARCALMKMRMLARAAESDSVDDRCAQA